MTQLNYNIIQGIPYRIRVYSQNSIIIIKGPDSILQFNEVLVQNDQMYLNILIDQNNYIDGGLYQFQLFENNLLKEAGVLRVTASLLVNPDQDLRGKYQIIVDAIEKQIAGVATHGQKVVKVNDKQIQYYSAQELMELLSFFRGKLKEQESGDSNTNTANDQMVQKYVFRIR